MKARIIYASLTDGAPSAGQTAGQVPGTQQWTSQTGLFTSRSAAQRREAPRQGPQTVLASHSSAGSLKGPCALEHANGLTDKWGNQNCPVTFTNFYQSIKPTVNITLNGERLKPFPLRSGTRKGSPLLPLLLKVLEGIQNRKEVEFSICRWPDLPYTKFLKIPKTLLKLIKFSRAAGYKTSI